MSVARNFFLGKEPTKKIGPLEILDLKKMNRECMIGLKQIGIEASLSHRIRFNSLWRRKASHCHWQSGLFWSQNSYSGRTLRNLSIREQRNTLNHIQEARNKGSSVIFYYSQCSSRMSSGRPDSAVRKWRKS